MQAPVAIGLDVGGTKILSGLVARDGSVLAEHDVPGPGGSEEGVLAALPLDDVDLVSRSRERFGLPAGIEDDGSAATLAEWWRGVGDGTQNLVMLTLGTGVGGGIVIDGRLFRGWAHLGHANRGVRIVPAELDPEAGLVGASLVAFEALDGVR